MERKHPMYTPPKIHHNQVSQFHYNWNKTNMTMPKSMCMACSPNYQIKILSHRKISHTKCFLIRQGVLIRCNSQLKQRFYFKYIALQRRKFLFVQIVLCRYVKAQYRIIQKIFPISNFRQYEKILLDLLI